MSIYAEDTIILYVASAFIFIPSKNVDFVPNILSERHHFFGQ